MKNFLCLFSPATALGILCAISAIFSCPIEFLLQNLLMQKLTGIGRWVEALLAEMTVASSLSHLHAEGSKFGVGLARGLFPRQHIRSELFSHLAELTSVVGGKCQGTKLWDFDAVFLPVLAVHTSILASVIDTVYPIHCSNCA